MLFPKICDITTKEVTYVTTEDTIFDALERIVSNNYKQILVKKSGKYALLSTNDIIELKSKGIDFHTRLLDIYLEEIPTIKKDANILDTLGYIKSSFEAICVLDHNDELYGIATSSDILASIDPHIILDNTPIGDLFKERDNFIICTKETTLGEVIESILSINSDSALILDDENRVKGIVTSKDINSAIFNNSDLSTPVNQFMVSPVETLAHTKTINEAISFIQDRSFHRIVVTNEQSGKLIGLITQQDLISLMLHPNTYNQGHKL